MIKTYKMVLTASESRYIKHVFRCLEGLYCFIAAIIISENANSCATGTIWSLNIIEMLLFRGILDGTLVIIRLIIVDNINGDIVSIIEVMMIHTFYFLWWMLAWVLVVNPTNMSCLLHNDIGAALFFIAVIYETMLWVARWQRAIVITALDEYDEHQRKKAAQQPAPPPPPPPIEEQEQPLTLTFTEDEDTPHIITA